MLAFVHHDYDRGRFGRDQDVSLFESYLSGRQIIFDYGVARWTSSFYYPTRLVMFY